MSLIHEVYGEGFNKTPFQVLLQLDRYTIKEMDTSKLKIGDIIVAIYDDSDPEKPQKDWGRVTQLTGNHVTFWGEVREQEFTVPLRKVYIPIDAKWSDAVDRMVEGNMLIDMQYTEGWYNSEFEDRIRDGLLNERIIPGGRVQASLGAREKYGKELNLTAYNCYVLPGPRDSRKGILETLTQMAEIMARGGGVGIPVSTLRPKYAKVYGVNGTSSGAVSWGGVYSYVTGLIEQGGSRRGALMLQLHCTHPDILDFISAKKVAGKIENANLSVQLTIEFMKAVEKDLDWHLIFPDIRHPHYESKWGAEYQDIHDWQMAGLPVEIYQTIKARELFHKITEGAWESGEPGFVVYDHMNYRLPPTQKLIKTINIEDGRELYVLDSKDYSLTKPFNNTFYYQKNICTNPCGEQPLPAWGVCNLIHINLAEFYDPYTRDVKWDLLRQTVHDTVRFADNIIDYTPYHFEANREVQMAQRRIGMGSMGLADLLIDLQLRYGSPEANEFIDRLDEFIKNEAYLASAFLARERGPFPMYDERILEARVPASLHYNVKGVIKLYGLRNSHLLTQAPTGTTATKTGRKGYSVGTGIEPFIAMEWTRTSRMGSTREYLGKAKEWLAGHPGEELPDYFVSAMGTEPDGSPQISPMAHVDVQAVVQRHNDSAISKTVNVPKSTSLASIRGLYLYGVYQGLIGMTVFRHGSREEQVLTVDEQEKPQENPKGFYKRPRRLKGETIKTPTPFGKAYMVVNWNDHEEIEEMFIKLGKTGADISAIADGLAIALTGMLSPRISHLTQEEKLEWLIKKYRGISGANFVGFGPDRVDSLPDAVAKVLTLLTVEDPPAEEYDTEPAPRHPDITSMDICPECGMSTFVRQDGCYTCQPDLGGCGYSKCA